MPPEEAIDGIFIFASICVGLAAGIGHLGVAAVMAVFFCFANPIDDARVAKKTSWIETAIVGDRHNSAASLKAGWEEK
jgi:uncharacterized membrane protein YhiD involved in acid resistance